MEKLSRIELKGEELNGLPLYFHKIYYNQIVSNDDEEKCYFYSRQVGAVIVKNDDPTSDISKILNYSNYENYVKK